MSSVAIPLSFITRVATALYFTASPTTRPLAPGGTGVVDRQISVAPVFFSRATSWRRFFSYCWIGTCCRLPGDLGSASDLPSVPRYFRSCSPQLKWITSQAPDPSHLSNCEIPRVVGPQLADGR